MKRKQAPNPRPAAQQGQALILVIVFLLTFALTLVLGYQTTMILGKKTSRQSIQGVHTYALSEGGVEDAIMRLRRDPSIGQNSAQTLTLIADNQDSVSTVVEPTQQINNRKITASGHRNTLTRKIEIKLQISNAQNASFHYAIQTGNDGFLMAANSRLNGNVYTNGSIIGASHSTITGDAWAHTTISSPYPTISGSRHPGAPIVDLPAMDLDYWRQQANINNDAYQGNMTISSAQDLGPKRINGDLDINGGGDLNIKGPLYITGNFTINPLAALRLSEDFGSSGTIILVDGFIIINSNSSVYATSANPRGYIMLLSANGSISPAAIQISSNTTDGLLYAYNGAVQLNSNCRVTSATGGRQIILNSNAEIVYDIGLANGQFTTGPGGGWAVISWKEVK